jgi:hypothetical protein
MRNGIFNTSKYRGKLQKMGVLYTHSPKSPGPFPNFQKINQKIKRFQKLGTEFDRDQVSTCSWQVIAGLP